MATYDQASATTAHFGPIYCLCCHFLDISGPFAMKMVYFCPNLHLRGVGQYLQSITNESQSDTVTQNG